LTNPVIPLRIKESMSAVKRKDQLNLNGFALIFPILTFSILIFGLILVAKTSTSLNFTFHKQPEQKVLSSNEDSEKTPASVEDLKNTTSLRLLQNITQTLLPTPASKESSKAKSVPENITEESSPKDEIDEKKDQATESDKDEEGKIENEVESEIENPDTEEVKFNSDNNQIDIEIKKNRETQKLPQTPSRLKLTLKGDRKIELESQENKITLQSVGQAAEINFPILFNAQTGQLFVATPNGQKEIRILPDQAADIARTSGIQNQITKIQLLEENEPSTSDNLLFKVEGKREGNLIGILPVSVTSEIEIGAQSGEVIKISMPFWFKILSPLVI